MPRGIVIEIIGDDRSYIRAAERTIAANKSIGASNTFLTRNTQSNTDAQIASRVKAQLALEASIAGLSAKANALPSGSKTQAAAVALQAEEQAKLNRLLGVSTLSTHKFSAATKEGERDLNKIVRGGLAGSGVFSKLGRSLAFASSGFIAFAVGAQVIRSSIDAARNLAIAQRQVSKQLTVGGASWKEYGSRIDEATLKLTHLAGFTRTDLLQAFTGLFRVTGSVKESLHLTAVAADVARGRHIALSAASNALAKAAGGSFSALRRLNIIVPKGATTMQALTFVQQKYAGQAKAGTSAQDRFNATFVATQEIIGTALLPTVTKYLTQLGNWLAKMNESGRLQRDVNHFVSDAGDLFHTVGAVIHGVDRITGSFIRTLEILAAFRLASLAAGWATSLKGLAASWGLVATSAERAEAAQAAALSGGAAGKAAVVGREGAVAGAVGAGAIIGRGGRPGPASAGVSFTTKAGELTRVSEQTASRFPIATAAIGRAGTVLEGFAPLAAILIGLQVIQSNTYKKLQAEVRDQANKGGSFLGEVVHDLSDNIFQVGHDTADSFHKMIRTWKGFLFGVKTSSDTLAQAERNLGITRKQLFGPVPGSPANPRPFGNAKPQKQFTQKFDLRAQEQLAQAQAQLTRTTRDDVRSAKQIAARIKKLIDAGRLHGQALVQALGLEASALSTIWSAEDAAAQKRAQKAQAAKDRIQRQLENSIDPLKLEIALSRAEAFGKPILPHLRALLRAAEAALAKGLTGALEKQALDQIASLKQQIKDALTTPTVTFALSPKLQLALARDAALGIDPTKDLLKAKRAILKFIRTHKKNFAALTDAYNQLADINSQLGSSASSALGLFKQASTKALTAGLGLTAAQRRALRARLSQLGPGGTVPGSGVGAGGFAIDPNTGRPIALHDLRHRRGDGSDDHHGGGRIKVENKIDLNVYIDGKHVEASVTRRQQRRGQRNPHQRRGPNAG